MQKITIKAPKTAQRGLLLASTLFSVVMFAQTEKESAIIRKSNNTDKISAFKKLLDKNTLSTVQLKAKAQKMNLKYEDTVNGKFYQLVGFDKNGTPLYYETANADAAAGTGTNILNDEAGLYRLDGQNMNIYEWDGGVVLVGQQEFQGRASVEDGTTTLSDHATHVGGTMIAGGINPKAKGMAYRAKLKSYYWDNDETEMATAAANGALVSNHSYGYTGGFSYGSQSGNIGWHWFGDDADTEYKLYGQYLDTDAQWDYISNNAPYYLPVKAAGNPRGDGPEAGGIHYVYINGSWKSSTKVRQKNGGTDGFDSLNQGSTSKNTLIVAAAEKLPYGYNSPLDVKPASFSGFGPTDDGRIKPDIAGIGVDIFSASSSGTTSYTTMSGTSMASPNVTGNLALLQQHYNRLNPSSYMKGATLRALVIHTAKEAGANDGPDYGLGWGLLDARKAADVISTNGKYSEIKEETLNNTEKKEYNLVANGTEPLKVTITWVDPTPTVLSNSSILDDPTKMLVNDLDIRVFDENNVEYFPWKLDPINPSNAATTGDNVVDNVEQIVIKSPTAGATYKVVVSHKGTLKKNATAPTNTTNATLTDATEQAFSLIATGVKGATMADIKVNSVKVTVDSNSYSTATPVEVSYSNIGQNTISSATITVTAKNTNTNEVVSSQSFNITNLASGATSTEIVNLDLSKAFVFYNIEAKATLTGDEVNVNDAAYTNAFTTLVDLTPSQTQHRFGFNDNFETNGWTSEDKNNDGRTWYKYDSSSLAKEGASFAINFANRLPESNDWLFSNPLKLKANTKYLISFHSRKFNSTLQEPLQVFMGKGATSADMTTQVSPVISAPILYNQYIYEVIPTEDGIYHFGFNQNVASDTTSYAVAVDDVIIRHAENKPLVDFTASKTTATTFDNVTLSNETIVDSSTSPQYTWTISPSTFTYVTGNSTTKSPVVKFNQEDVYTVTLKATNSFGSDEVVKTNYITVKNVATVANFSANKTDIFEGENVTFTNNSTGSPTPSEYKWVITPSEGVTFSTNDTATSPVVSFANEGVYSVSLTAKSPMNQDTKSISNYINVKSLHGKVRNLTADLNTSTKNVTLKWVRPILLDNDFEGFETGTTPTGYKLIDANADTYNWRVRRNTTSSSGSTIKFAKTGRYGIASFSYTSTGIDADNYMITNKLEKGSEVLKFSAFAPYTEKLDIYIVPAPASGTTPTLEEIKNVQPINYSIKNKDFENFIVDIKGKTDTDFYVAFHHNTKKEDDAYYIAIDDIALGYDNTVTAPSQSSAPSKPNEIFVSSQEIEAIKNGKILLIDEETVNKENTTSNEIITFSATEYPKLTGYEVSKNGIFLTKITDPTILTIQDNVAGDTGTIIYGVKALYSDNTINSTEVFTSVDLTQLSTVDNKLSSNEIATYPNPSTGVFTLDAGKDATSFDAKVYDISGKLIKEINSKEQKYILDLTSYGKGVYILNIKLQNGKNISTKLIVK